MRLEEKRAYVQQFFSATGETYDHIVSLCTFGIDGLWKSSILARLDNPLNVLDLACGTGILTLAIAKRFPRCRLTGVDITEGYLNVARKKIGSLHAGHVQIIQQWAEEFSSEELFDSIVSSYLAKYADLPNLVRKSYRMLKPGGLLLFHDFTYPKNRMIALSWELYFKLLQKIGPTRYPEWRNVFFDLPVFIKKSRWVEELSAAMRENDLTDIRVENLTLQGAALVSGRKPF